jgi:hypothetical protein
MAELVPDADRRKASDAAATGGAERPVEDKDNADADDAADDDDEADAAELAAVRGFTEFAIDAPTLLDPYVTPNEGKTNAAPPASSADALVLLLAPAAAGPSRSSSSPSSYAIDLPPEVQEERNELAVAAGPSASAIVVLIPGTVEYDEEAEADDDSEPAATVTYASGTNPIPPNSASLPYRAWAFRKKVVKPDTTVPIFSATVKKGRSHADKDSLSRANLSSKRMIAP